MNWKKGGKKRTEKDKQGEGKLKGRLRQWNPKMLRMDEPLLRLLTKRIETLPQAS